MNPAFTDRLAALTRPRWARTATARRIAAAVLVLIAIALYLRGDPNTERVSVVVAAHDLQPGRIVSTDDLTPADRESGSLPDGAIVDADQLIGHTLAGATRAGELFTDLRILGPRLAAGATGAVDARVVPIRLADPAVADMLREGDRVDVLRASDESSDNAAVLATDAVVVLVSPAEGGHGSKDRVVMLALPADGAAAIAAASLNSALAVIFH